MYFQLNFAWLNIKGNSIASMYVNKNPLLFKNVLETMPEDFCFQTDKLFKDLEDNIQSWTFAYIRLLDKPY